MAAQGKEEDEESYSSSYNHNDFCGSEGNIAFLSSFADYASSDDLQVRFTMGSMGRERTHLGIDHLYLF